jgi:methylated-DNA-[protein]-cysteine S-methyltransferase
MSGRWWRQPTPLGEITVVTGATGGVIHLAFGADRPGEGPPRPLARVARELDEYFAGTRRTFTVGAVLEQVDAPFRRAVLEAVAREVPYGETATYGEVAELVGHPGAARAVGTAMAHNPVQLLVPCHRVVAANGIGGYGPSGVALKRALLDREQRAVAAPAGRASRPRA